MILASHIIFTAYGYWLPNEERGSWSQFVAAWELFRYGGKATKTESRRSLADRPHDRNRRDMLKQKLKHPPVIFNGRQARSIANGFAKAAVTSGYVIHACSIMPDHVHLVIARHKHQVEMIANQLKGAATKRLRADGLDPFGPHVKHTPWADSQWKVFLDCRADILRAIPYVENNPKKEGLRPQRWKFVVPYA